jgi:hypothetical protein
VTLTPWWERFPGLLELELDALRSAEIEHSLDVETQTQRGVVRIGARPLVRGAPIDVVATFPDLYPYFKFEVQAPDLHLERHQHPFGTNLCLIGRATNNWNVDDTLAEYLVDRLPTLLRVDDQPESDEAAAAEEHQGEPSTDYYTYFDRCVVLVDSGWKMEAEHGTLAVGIEDGSLEPTNVRGAVLQVFDASGGVLADADPRLARRYARAIEGRWVRLDVAPQTNDPRKVVEMLTDIAPEITKPNWQRHGRTKIDITGVVFKEEVGWRDWADAWLFVVRFIHRSVP